MKRRDPEAAAEHVPVPPAGNGGTEGRTDTGRDRPRSKPLRVTYWDELDHEPAKEWLVDGVYGCGEMSSTFGAPGSGKSVLVGDKGVHIATGKDWFGRKVKKGAVLYVAAERAALVRRRLLAWKQANGVTDAALAVIAGTIDLRTSDLDVKQIITAAKAVSKKYGMPVELIPIDTTNRALAGGEENTSKDMGALVANATRIQEEIGAHIDLVHHIPADGELRLRGHGSFLGALDTTLGVEESASERSATIIKNNDGEEGTRFAFTLASHSLVDQNGEPIGTAPLVVPLEGRFVSATKAGKAAKPMAKSAQTALRALREAIAEMGEPATASNHIPAGVTVTTLERWRDYAYRMGISASDTTDRAKQKAFRIASDNLIASQLVGVWNEQVWIP